MSASQPAKCDALFDIHSGGKTMMFSPFACYHRLADEALTERAKAAVAAMAAPISLELVELDAEVSQGDPVGQIHFPERPERAPVVCRAGTSGTVIGRTHKVLVGPGDFLALIAHDL